MAENLQKRPTKGILKNSSSFDKQDGHSNAKKAKEATFDEMNIIATLHPPDKDYGHMKIDEPKTPFNLNADELDRLDASDLAEKLKLAVDRPPKFQQQLSDEDSDDDDLTEEEKQNRKEFRQKRKKHYNEFYAVQLARKLLEEEDEDEDDDDESSSRAIQSTSSKTPDKDSPSKKSPESKRKSPTDMNIQGSSKQT